MPYTYTQHTVTVFESERMHSRWLNVHAAMQGMQISPSCLMPKHGHVPHTPGCTLADTHHSAHR